MSADAERQIGLDDAIIVDEIGIESGCYGIYRLRSLYQPIFKRREKTLKMVAAEGTAAPYVAGEEVPFEVFLAAVADDDHDFIGRMGLALALRNLRNIGLDAIELVVDPEGIDPGALIDRIQLVVGELAGSGLDPGNVVCALGEHAASDGALLSRLAEEMRSHGLRIAVSDFGAGHWTDAAVDLLKPEIVRIDGDWFRQVCRDATTVRLFDAVVSRLRERQSKVLVTGIDSEHQFAVALRAGADLFQGPHLAAPALAGTVIGEAPLSIAEKLGDAQRIVPLFG
jgi:EAL domain-containing protein (putative c-di-GMP-specific phosphodiesterase class I)